VVACGSYSVGPYPLPVSGSRGQRASLIHRHKSRFRLGATVVGGGGILLLSAGLACAVRGCLGSPPVWPRRAGPCLFSLSTRSASGSLAKHESLPLRKPRLPPLLVKEYRGQEHCASENLATGKAASWSVQPYKKPRGPPPARNAPAGGAAPPCTSPRYWGL
jgi:hypothetical protein